MVATGLEAMAQIYSIDWREAGLDWLDASGIGQPSTRLQLDLYRAATTRELAGRDNPALSAATDWLIANDPGNDLGAAQMDDFTDREEMISLYEQASRREVRATHYREVFGAMRFCAIF